MVLTLDLFSHSSRVHEIVWERWVHNGTATGIERTNLTTSQNLAWHEMRMLLISVILKFDVQLSEESAEWDDQKVYTMWEKKPLMCTLVPV
jgi:hypothetical protein